MATKVLFDALVEGAAGAGFVVLAMDSGHQKNSLEPDRFVVRGEDGATFWVSLEPAHAEGGLDT